jgi:hypothetical protein
MSLTMSKLTARINIGLYRIFKNKPVQVKPLEDIKKYFEFLVTDFGFQLAAIDSPFIDSDGKKSDRHVCYYRNERSRLQLEVVGSGSWFYCYLRRFSFGTPSHYSDNSNSLGFETFAKVESQYDYKNFIPFYVGWENVLQNTAELIKRHKTFFVSELNDEIDLFDQLKEYAHKNNLEFNDFWQRIENPFFTNLKKQTAPLFIENGFHLVLDSSALAPFDSTKMVDFVIYENGKSKIRISQVDWRDLPYIYCLSKNNKLIFELNFNIQPNKEYGIKQLLEHLKKCL